MAEENRESALPENESLRTRIAAVLYERFATAMGFADAAWDDTEHETWLEDADAVIRELGLEPQAHYDPDCDYFRYVTEWTADE